MDIGFDKSNMRFNKLNMKSDKYKVRTIYFSNYDDMANWRHNNLSLFINFGYKNNHWYLQIKDFT